MFDFLPTTLPVVPVVPWVALVRLAAALAFGFGVALIYRRTRPASEVAPSFTATLVLLAILIAMVTQVIGDNVARAFSLVGALSIVRFRTVVRDTQDTAYVIFAVAVGMAIGAGNLWIAVGGMVIVAAAALMVKPSARSARAAAALTTFTLETRLSVGHDVQARIVPVLDAHVRERRLISIATAKQGLSVDVCYQISLAADELADALLKALNRLDGVQNVVLHRITPNEEGQVGS